MADAAKPKLRWYQYSLRSLLLLTLLANLGMSWVAVRMQRARRQQAAVEAIRKLGGWVEYDYEIDQSGHRVAGATPPGAAWLRSLLGDDFFTNVVEASIWSDVGLEHLDELPQLKVLSLHHAKITDAGLEHLKGLTQLQSLDIDNTQITDAGLEHLKGLTQLENLDLIWTKISDAGLEHLKGLTKLKTLDLYATHISGAGLVHLKTLTQLQRLRLSGDQITGAGLEHLTRLPQLRDLRLHCTRISDATVECLKGLTQLQELRLEASLVTLQGEENLQKALPNCQISVHARADNATHSVQEDESSSQP